MNYTRLMTNNENSNLLNVERHLPLPHFCREEGDPDGDVYTVIRYNSYHFWGTCVTTNGEVYLAKRHGRASTPLPDNHLWRPDNER